MSETLDAWCGAVITSTVMNPMRVSERITDTGEIALVLSDPTDARSAHPALHRLGRVVEAPLRYPRAMMEDSDQLPLEAAFSAFPAMIFAYLPHDFIYNITSSWEGSVGVFLALTSVLTIILFPIMRYLTYTDGHASSPVETWRKTSALAGDRFVSRFTPTGEETVLSLGGSPLDAERGEIAETFNAILSSGDEERAHQATVLFGALGNVMSSTGSSEGKMREARRILDAASDLRDAVALESGRGLKAITGDPEADRMLRDSADEMNAAYVDALLHSTVKDAL